MISPGVEAILGSYSGTCYLVFLEISRGVVQNRRSTRSRKEWLGAWAPWVYELRGKNLK